MIYFDLDGVLAKWRNVPVWITHLPLYFLFLRKDRAAAALLLSLMKAGYPVGILSKAYNRRAAFEKRLWVRLLVGKVPVIVVPYGESKLSYVSDENAILIDDYTPNLREWILSGRTGIKYKNGLNGKKWTGLSVSYDMPVQMALSIVTAAAS